MIIKIVKVSEPETVPTGKGRSYKKLEVLYVNDKGDRVTKNLVSFKNPSVFSIMSNAKEGEQYDVKNVKNEQTGYFDWAAAQNMSGATVAVSKTEDVKPVETVAEKAPGKVTGSNWETAAERAFRQVLIVRQSQVANAIEYVKAQGAPFGIDDVTDVAAKLETWVFRNENPYQEKPVAAEVVATVANPRGRPKKVAEPTDAIPAETEVV